MSANTQPRTLHELVMDVRFSACLHRLVERWFLLLHDANEFVSLILFSSVLLSLLQKVEALAIGLAGIGALLHAINITYGSVRRAQEHRDLYKRFQELDAQLSSNALTLNDGEKAYRLIEMDEPPQSARFARIAHAQNLRTHGYADETAQAERELTFVDRIVRAML